MADRVGRRSLGDAEVLLELAISACEGGARRQARDHVVLAHRISEELLRSAESWYFAWPEWDQFERACDRIEASISWILVPRGILVKRLAGIRDVFLGVEAKAERTGAIASPAPASLPPPDLSTQLEDLVVLVWRCEDQWRLNDRLV